MLAYKLHCGISEIVHIYSAAHIIQVSVISSTFPHATTCYTFDSQHRSTFPNIRLYGVFIYFIFFTRHMQGGSLPPQAPAPPVGYVSSTMVSDLETDLPDDEEEEEEDEEEDEGYGARHPRGIEHTPGSSMDNLDSSLTGKAVGFVSGAGGALT